MKLKFLVRFIRRRKGLMKLGGCWRMNKNNSEGKMIVFDNKKIRRIWHNEDWFFSVVDVVGVLIDSGDSRKYWNKLSQRLREEGSEVVTVCHRLKLRAEDGKMRETDCVNKRSVFRIIQSIPSRNAEPFKLWLAKVGSDRIDEIENPELAQERMKELYELKGYSKEWIDKRLRGMAIRQNLTDEWDDRGVDEGVDFAILTNEISKATFGKSVGEYKKLKNLEGENLRDHMNELELIFGMLGEKVSTEITISKDSKGFDECVVAAKEGGDVAGNARREAEEKIGKPVVSEDNYLGLDEGDKKKKRKRILEVKDE
jgi:DNA-damage-inducible protein D